jgi:peptidoglycan/xylan/chitin deacetylase (PgdA/CDA1 family)
MLRSDAGFAYNFPVDVFRHALERVGPVWLSASLLAGGAAAAHAVHGAGGLSPNVLVLPPSPASSASVTGPRRAIAAPRSATAAPALAPRTVSAVAEPPTEDALDAEAEYGVDGPAAHPGPFAEALRGGMVVAGHSAHRLLLFTFDDGPDPRNTPRLLDTLDREGVKAVFFITASRMTGPGGWARTNRRLAREALRRGHIVGNHTLDHPQLPTLGREQILEQLRRADEIFEDSLGDRSWLVRPPGGARSGRVDALIAELGYTQVLWSIDTGDYLARTSSAVLHNFERALARREREGIRGGIILLHDTHAWSVDAVPLIMRWIRARNCELLAEGEELYDVVDEPSYFHAPRDDGARVGEAAPTDAADPQRVEARQAQLRELTRQRCAPQTGPARPADR